MFSLNIVDCRMYSLLLSSWIFCTSWVEGIIITVFTLWFLAAKAQLNTCTCDCVCLSVRFKT